jgi:sporulation protein YlmC with PRC-barrel domain
MTNPTSRLSLAALALGAALATGGPASAQVAGGTTTVDTHTSETTQVALGWSVKKTLLGKTIYNAAGRPVGKVQDLIISPDKNVSYVIVGAGGFIGIGRHDVAIPVNQIQSLSGRLVMPGATPAMVKAMPEFDYADGPLQRDQFVASAERDIARGRAQLVHLEKKSGQAAPAARAGIDLKVIALQGDVESAEGRLNQMKQASAVRWKEFEAGVSAATARLRKSIETSAG